MASSKRPVVSRDADYNLVIRCLICADQYHFSCVYPQVEKDKMIPYLTLWRCEKCFE